ncbi:epididymal-specific lipocalin-12 [Hipposideros larvatus]
MGPLCALWVVLTLLEAGTGQTLNPPAIAPVLQSFQEDQSRGHHISSAQTKAQRGQLLARVTPSCQKQGSHWLLPVSLFQGEWFVLGLAGNTYRKADRSLLNSFIATFEQTGNGRLSVSYAMTRGQRCITWSYVLIPEAQPGKFSVDNSRCERVGGGKDDMGGTGGRALTWGCPLRARGCVPSVPWAVPSSMPGAVSPPCPGLCPLHARGCVPSVLRVVPSVPPDSLEEVQVHDTNYTTFALMLSRRQSGSPPVIRVHLLCRMWAIETQVLDRFVCLVRAQGLLEDNIVFPDVTDWSPHLDTC